MAFFIARSHGSQISVGKVNNNIEHPQANEQDYRSMRPSTFQKKYIRITQAVLLCALALAHA